MDLKASLVDTNLKIYPSEKLLNYLKNISISDDIPENIQKLIKTKNKCEINKKVEKTIETAQIHLNNEDIKNIKKVEAALESLEGKKVDNDSENPTEKESVDSVNPTTDEETESTAELDDKKTEEKRTGPFLYTSDIDWLYVHLQKARSTDKDIPHLHTLLEGIHLEMPENQIIKRNPDLEARCVKLRAQQEARDYRKMTKGVDNVRMRFPDDSIAFQLKQLNRQLIAIGQFILSIFAGFLFGFRGVEWMVGNLDFGFRLLLGVMCALIIALAEIYFLAKKLNEELSVPETIQLGGPPKFVDDKTYNNYDHKKKKLDAKEHQD